MTTYSIKAAKARWEDLLQAAERGEEVIIARRKTPVARLIRVLAEPQQDEPK